MQVCCRIFFCLSFFVENMDENILGCQHPGEFYFIWIVKKGMNISPLGG